MSYKVCYRGKPGYEEIVHGTHANFCANMQEVNDAISSCKKWFNDVIVKEPIADLKTGKVLKPAEHENRDNVFVWYDTYIDGQLAESGEEAACGGGSDSTISNTTSSGEPTSVSGKQPTKKSKQPEEKSLSAASA